MRLPATALFLAVLATAPAAAQSSDVVFGFRAGIADLDCIDIEDGPCIDTDIAPSAGAFMDYGVTERLFGGLYVDAHGVEGEFGDDREIMLDVGATLKANMGARARRAYFRPGVGVGYGMLDVGENARFLTTRATLEVAIPRLAGVAWLVEGGVYFAPMGSAGDADVTFGPGFLLRGGLLF